MNLNKPLDGITVLDLTVALAGPFATLILAGLGAKVIRVENPANPDAVWNDAKGETHTIIEFVRAYPHWLNQLAPEPGPEYDLIR